MNNEGVSSIVVVDNHLNVIGNISTTDVKVCTPCTPMCLTTCFLTRP